MGTVEYKFVNDAGEERVIAYAEDTPVPVGTRIDDGGMIWTCVGVVE